MNSEHDSSRFSTPGNGSPNELPPAELATTVGSALPADTTPPIAAPEESPPTVSGLPPLAAAAPVVAMPPPADDSPSETETSVFSKGDSQLDPPFRTNPPAKTGSADASPLDGVVPPVAPPVAPPVLNAPATPASPAPALRAPLRAPSEAPSKAPSTPAAPSLPDKIGRFDIVRLLGKGGFGEVYLGRDSTLRRHVALKIPNWEYANSAESEHEFLEEARKLVDVKGPGIVIVHEILPVTLAGQSRICIVQEFIDGQNLAEWRSAQPKPIDIDRIAQLVAEIATILSPIHRQKLVHRDLKPANIMIDRAGRPFVLDFGLAIRDNQRRENSGMVAGTRPYMSPEQVRGETHRMDARSDIWSLGVILYELFSGQRPFGGSNTNELFDEIEKKDPWPLRQLIADFPLSLDRICLKCLNKLRNDRYTTTAELAADLRNWRDTPAATPPKAGRGTDPSAADPSLYSADSVRPSTPPNPSSSSGSLAPSGSPNTASPSVSATPPRVIPRGLRSFTAEDSEFFLELLPGVRERSGLPESIDFWKRRIESLAPEHCVPIGLLSGPSGCGKSSLVKAGLLPRLEPRVIQIYLEATQDTTEQRLLGMLRHRVPAIPAELGLKEVLEGLRQNRWLRANEKVLIVIDQFEQWLYAHRAGFAGELSDALRQCDGRCVQTMLMVRDDYAPLSFDFMTSLDFDVAERKNFRKVALFDLKHARKVLTLFGQAYEQLPGDADALTAGQNAFLDAAVAALDEDQDYKVVSVKLAMFAQLMQAREWTPDTLQSLGGVQGVGLAFLRESFDADDASPLCRRHADAAMRVLKSLLPPSGAAIKGHSRTADELAAAAGYSDRPANFDALLKILDDELRLVTPAYDDTQKTVGYQLTHDYLVPSLSTWLEEKLRVTRRGRAQLRLQERADAWTVKPENRQLPSLGEYLRIATLTPRREWTEPQRRMMRRAGRHLATVWGALVMATALTVAGAVWFYSAQKRESERNEVRIAVDALQNAPASALAYALKDLQRLNPSIVLKELERRFGEKSAPDPETDTEASRVRRLRLAQALASYGRADVDYLVASIAVADGGECDNLVTALKTAPRSRWEPELLKAMHSADEAGRASKDWTHKAKLAIVGLQIGAPAVAIDLHRLRDRPDPTQQTQFIHDFFGGMHGDLSQLLQEAQIWDDAGLLYGLSLSLGKVPKRDFQASWAGWRDLLLRWHRDHPDSGVHSASGWALRQWGETLPNLSEPSRREPPDSRNWWPHEFGFTLLRIPAGEFEQVDDDVRDTKPRPQRKVRLGEFWISDREVTVELYQRFLNDKSETEKPIAPEAADELVSPTPEHPMQGISWFDAVLFCNWLSRSEGRKPFYVCLRRNPTTRNGILRNKPVRDEGGEWEVSVDPAGNGYRLLTEAEWEYACRAGSSTEFSYGDEARWLTHYATFDDGTGSTGSATPTGLRSCNRYGAFDMHGNVWEWCWDWHAPLPVGDVVDPVGRFAGSLRVYRGGSWSNRAANCRAARRSWLDPANRTDDLGFRLALSFVGVSAESGKDKKD